MLILSHMLFGQFYSIHQYLQNELLRRTPLYSIILKIYPTFRDFTPFTPYFTPQGGDMDFGS